jgi:hypothetical protein
MISEEGKMRLGFISLPPTMVAGMALDSLRTQAAGNGYAGTGGVPMARTRA